MRTQKGRPTNKRVALLTLREKERKARCRALKAAAEKPSGRAEDSASAASVRLSPHTEKRVQFDLTREAQLTKLRARGTFSLLYQVCDVCACACY